MKKRFFSIVSVLALLFVFAGCSGNEKGSSSGKKDDNPDKGLEVLGEAIKYDPNHLVNDGEPIDLEYWTWIEDDAVSKLIKDYEKIYPNVKIKTVIQPWEDIWTKLPLALKGNNGPALFAGHTTQHNNLINYMAPYDIPIDELRADFPSVEPHIIDGKVFYTDSVISTGNIFYNKTLWKEAGLTENDIPKTWDQLREVAKRLTKIDDSGKMTQAGFNYNGGGGYDALIMAMNYQKGQLLYSEDGKEIAFNNDITKENTKILVDFYEKDKIGSKDFGDDSTMSFGNGQSAMVYKWGWMAGELSTKYKDLEYGVFATPTFDAETVPFAYDRYNGEITPGINKNQSKEQQAVAQDFLKYLLANDKYTKENAFKNSGFPAKESLSEDKEILEHPVLRELAPRIERLIWPGPFPSTIESTSSQVIQNILYNGESVDKAVKNGADKMNKESQGDAFVSLESSYKYFDELK